MTGPVVYRALGKNYCKQGIVDKDKWLTVYLHCHLTNNHQKDKLFAFKVLKNNCK